MLRTVSSKNYLDTICNTSCDWFTQDGIIIKSNEAFATSVSAKSVSLKQAVMIASVCEFTGAMLLGASVTSTIKGKVSER